MNQRFLATALAVALIGATAQRAPTQSKEHRPLAVGKEGKAIAAWLAKSEAGGFTGAVLAAKNGKVVAAIGVGNADRAKKTPITPATLFEIASLSKQITATAAVRLAQQKKLGLDDPIAKHLPGTPESCNAITLRHLLQHTSGIPGTNSRGGGDDLSKVLPIFLDGGPRHVPGAHWEYWNQGYALATEIIARASKRSFVDYCRKELFKPAKMKSTCFTGDPAPRGAIVAIGKSASGNARSALEHPYGSFGFQYRGMGGVVTNVWDLWRWDRALAGKKILDERSKVELLRPGLEEYALGWYVKRERGRMLQSHGGGVRGFVCVGRRYPEHDACVFVLSNYDRAPVHVVANAVEQMLFGETVTVVLPNKDDVKAGGFLVGEYADPDGSKLTISIAGDRIRAEVKWKKGSVSRMIIAKDASGAFAVMVNTDRYDLKIVERTDVAAKTLGLWGRTFRRVP